MPASPKAPWTHRLGIVVFTIVAGVLFFWLLGFVVSDIGEIKGPELAEIEKSTLDPSLVSQETAIDRKIAVTSADIQNLKDRQTLLRDSTTSSQQTMNQLLDLQKQNIEKHIAPSLAEHNALAQSESLFLSNQAHYQTLNEEIAKRTEEQRSLESEKRRVDAQLATQKAQAAKKFEVLDRRHHLVVATFQLVFLIPILLIAAYILLRWRATIYAPLIYALGLATLTKVMLVIHEHFPTRYFKYILLLAALALVLRVLIYLIQSSARPKEAELLKQYREAYERFLCPLCEYPIRRGPMKYAFWNRRSVRKMAAVTSIPTLEEPYVCPSCGSRLFEMCGRCKTVRHSLLPFCTQCGQEDREGVAPNPASAV